MFYPYLLRDLGKTPGNIGLTHLVAAVPSSIRQIFHGVECLTIKQDIKLTKNMRPFASAKRTFSLSITQKSLRSLFQNEVAEVFDVLDGIQRSGECLEVEQGSFIDIKHTLQVSRRNNGLGLDK